MANQRPLNLTPMPIYYGQIGTDPDFHLSRFIACCLANRIPEDDYLVTFPATLQVNAFAWYQRQNQATFVNWD